MSYIHYKFASKLAYGTVIFNEPLISLSVLKREIMSREKLSAKHCKLQIFNAQTQKEYISEEDLIPKNSSVTVRRVPLLDVKTSNKTSVHDNFGYSSQYFKPVNNSAASSSVKISSLAEARASEKSNETKAVMSQSNYGPSHSVKAYSGTPLKSYTSVHCGNRGHYTKNCLTNKDKKCEDPKQIQRSTGIPRSFVAEVLDRSPKGTMLTNTGQYAIPVTVAEASIQETIKLPVLPEENEDPVPEELLCCICKQLMIDAALIPCCGNSYCDNCIRAALLESPKQTCPTCEQSDVSPDSLIPNKSLRLALNNFQNGKGYTRLKRKHLSSAPFTPAPKAAKIHRPAAGVPLSPLFISTAAIVPQQASGE